MVCLKIPDTSRLRIQYSSLNNFLISPGGMTSLKGGNANLVFVHTYIHTHTSNKNQIYTSLKLSLKTKRKASFPVLLLFCVWVCFCGFFFFFSSIATIAISKHYYYLHILCYHKLQDNPIVEVKCSIHQVLLLDRLFFHFLYQSPKYNQNYSEMLSFHSAINWFSGLIYIHSDFYALFTEILLFATLAYSGTISSNGTYFMQKPLSLA